MEHQAEIMSRPARTWFQSKKEKQKSAGKVREQGQLQMVKTHSAIGKQSVSGKRKSDQVRDSFIMIIISDSSI